MDTTPGAAPGLSPPGTRSQHWLARLSFVLAGLAIVLLLVFAGLKSLAMLAVAVAAAVVSLAAAYVFLSRRGVLRWLSLAVFVLVPIVVIVVYAFRHLLWIALLSAGVWLLASMTARAALAGEQPDWRMPEHPAQPPPRHPYLIMNPKSGGGKVEKFDLKRKAEALGAEVFLFGGSGPVDVAEVARAAVAGGADLLGVAGGDGTQALVAGIAAEHDIPFLVISAGTRNHFALDLGLDREDPSACLGALRDGVELRVDLGVINGQTFVNNASFGAYAEIVETPAYRDDKRNTTLNTLPDLLQGHRGAHLRVQADGTQIDAPQALLVSNNPYGTGDLAGLGRRIAAGSRHPRRRRRHREQRRAGGRPAPRQACRRAEGTGHEADRDHRRHAADPGRRRRRVDTDVDAGHLYGLAGRAPRLGATRPSGRPRTEAPGGLGEVAAPRGPRLEPVKQEVAIWRRTRRRTRCRRAQRKNGPTPGRRRR